MSRPVSPYTQAIRDLVDQHGFELTHQDARPLLKELGYKIAAEPPQKSDAFGTFEQYTVDLTDKASIADVVRECGFDEETAKSVVNEAKKRKAYKDERNNYDIVKYNWKKILKSGTKTASKKPQISKNTKARTAAGVVAATLPPPKHRRNANVVSASQDVLDLIEAAGGLSAAQSKVDDLRAEADALELAVEAFVALHERLTRAA